MPSQKSGILDLIAGAAMIAGGIGLAVITGGGASAITGMMIQAGAGMIVAGAGTLIAGEHDAGFATTTRNPISPWRICYGRVRTGGTMVFMNMWGDNAKMLDLVMVLAAHQCQGGTSPGSHAGELPELLFDQQRIQIDTNAASVNAIGGTSFTPVQQKVTPTSIQRVNNVVTVTLNTDIPYLSPGDFFLVESMPAGIGNIGLTLNGKWQVAEIVSRVPFTSLTFNFLSGGPAVLISSAGYIKTLWADYGRKVYMEVMLGNNVGGISQVLGRTFQGMGGGTPYDGDTGNFVKPETPGGLGGGVAAAPNPWTQFCSLQGKTAVFLRLHYNNVIFAAGLPQISFLMYGKNDIYDPRLGALSGVKTEGVKLNAVGSGYQTLDVLTLVQGGASGAQATVTVVDGSGGIVAFLITAQGTGYAVGTGLSVTGGHGSGATFNIVTLTGAAGTTGYTENPALCIADYLTNHTYGYKLQYGVEVPIADLIAAANICDQTVTLARGGTEPRYTLNGQFNLDMSRGEILQNMLTSCAGRLTTTDGLYVIQPGYWAGPGSPPQVMDLAAIAAGPFRWKPMPTVRELYNGVKGTYISPANGWQSSDFPYYAQDGLHGYFGPTQYQGDINLASDGGDRRWLDIHLPFTISPSMAQRIAKIELLRRRHFGTGTFMLNMNAYQLVPLDVLEANFSFLSWTNKLLEVQATRFSLSAQNAGGMDVPVLAVEVDVQETDSSIYTWTTSEELTPQGYQQGSWPISNAQELVPFAWAPGYVAPLNGDATYPQGALGPGSFGLLPTFSLDGSGNSVMTLAIKGALPINNLNLGISGPYITASTATTGGNLTPGTYIVAVSAYDGGAAPYKNTDYLDLYSVTIPAGTNTNSITVNLTWASGNDGGELYIAKQQLTPDQGAQLQQANEWIARCVFHFNQTLAAGVASATVTTFDESQPGGVDTVADHLAVVWQQEIHAGVWAQQVQNVTATVITIASLSAGDMTTNQWAGYTLSLLAKYNLDVEVPILNMPVASSTASTSRTVNGVAGVYFDLTIGPNAHGVQLPNLTTLLGIGDLVVMRDNATFTSSSFSDANAANAYYPTGDTGVEAGHLAVVLTGADAGDVQVIASVDPASSPGPNVVFNLAGQWQVTPATGDIVIVVAPPLSTSNVYECPRFSVPNRASMARNPIVAQPIVQNLANQTWFFQVRVETSKGGSCPDFLAPWRELYIFGTDGTQVISS